MAGLEGFEPPTPGFGDRCSSQTELQACLCCRRMAARSLLLPRFLVLRVLAAERAELPELDAVRVQPLVLRRDVIPPLAVVARQRDLIAHGASPRGPSLLGDLGDDAGA